MPETKICNICQQPGAFENASEVKKIPSNARRFQKELFTVWRCRNCQSLHCLEDIDYDNYYKDYTLKVQPLNQIARIYFGQRLQFLERAGIKKTDTILDYGGGNGIFVQFLKEQGYKRAVAYDPYSEFTADPSVLNEKFDVVTCQDVIEHDPDPGKFLKLIVSYLKPGGLMAVGTPDGSQLDLNSPYDVVGRLHQPFHRHLISRHELRRMIEALGLQVIYETRKFYVDTWVPFVNTGFLFHYIHATGGALEVWLEPMKIKLILTSPSLLIQGMIGNFLNKQKDIAIFARLAKP